jgi:tetratricopeptide (TPR) repeat protein
MNDLAATVDTSTDAIVAALKTGRMRIAERAARARVEARRDDAEAQMLLAMALAMQNRAAEAAEIYRELAARQPSETSHWNNLGNMLRESGDAKGAESAYRRALSLQPGNAGTLLSMGLLRWEQGDVVETRDLMLAAFRLNPDLPEPRIYGALASHECADRKTADLLLAGHERWPYLGPRMTPDLATALMNLEHADEAERTLRGLLVDHPETESVVRVKLASLFERVNRLDEAEEMLRLAETSGADVRETVALRATLAARRGRHDEAIGLYRMELASQDATVGRATRWFSLAKSCDQTGDAAGAMEALERGHALQYQQAARLMPDLAKSESEWLSITRYTVDEAAHARWLPDPGAPAAEDSPIFIVGFPRSGTTMLEQMLDAHPGLKSMDERAFLQDVIDRMQSLRDLRYPDDLGQLQPDELATLRETYWTCVAGVVKLAPGERLVDKNPLNVLRLPMIARLFPQARIVLALRHPCDVILSNYMQCFGAPAYQLLCSSLERLARGYASAMESWTRHAEVLRPAVLESRYEDLIDDFDGQTARIAAHLGLDDAGALRGYSEHARAKGFIATPSYSQVIEPPNRKAVDRWHRYRDYFGPVVPTVQPFIDRWGYDA